MKWFYLLFFSFSFTSSIAQLIVSDVVSVQQDVQGLAGDGVVISNVSYFYANGSGDDSPIGGFTDPSSTIGLSGGLLITTGSAKKAGGSNNSPSEGQANNSNNQFSSDLSKLVSGVDFLDLCIVEFDISVSSDVLTFNYVFGSEEYVEFVDQGYNDVFGFFISGPGINGVKNIALVPNSTIPVSVNSINDVRNTAYFINNGSGEVDVQGSPVQYDGYTVPLTAEARVTPCQIYHIKLVIADVGDPFYDSGVFIEANSFSSRNVPTVELIFEHERFDYAVEGCNNVKVRVGRGELDLLRLNESVEYYYEFLGSAVLDEDFVSSLNNFLIIPKGQEFIEFDIDIISDEEKEIVEFVQFVLTAGCSSFEKKYETKFQIYDEYFYGLNTQVACLNQESMINPSPKNNDDLFWYDEALSCQSCVSPIVIEDTTKWYVFDAKDIVSGCETTDSVYVIVWSMEADFEVSQAGCYTVQDFKFINTSEKAESYFWSFGDGETSEEVEPSHLFGDWSGDNNESSYVVSLVAVNEKYRCQDTLVKQVLVDDYVFVPNIITPNGDGKNEYFELNGFLGTCWLLSVYDRWGSLVFQEENYKNDWNGGDLSDGVYYYEVINETEDRPFKGTLLIVR